MATPPSEEVHSGKVQSHSESKLRGGQEVGSWELKRDKNNVTVCAFFFFFKCPKILLSLFQTDGKNFNLRQGSV